MRIIVLCFAVAIVGCTTNEPAGSEVPDHGERIVTVRGSLDVELLTRNGCQNSPMLLERLLLAIESMANVDFVIVDQEALAVADPRRGYTTPTILVDDRDLFGLPEPTLPYPAPT